MFNYGNKIILQPKSKFEHKFSLIWLHGFEEEAKSYVKTFTDKSFVDLPDTCRIVLVTAPEREMTSHDGKKMNSWFDIKSLKDMPNEETFTQNYLRDNFDQAQLRQSVKFVTQLIKKEILKLNGDSKRVFIGGFSQGASIALALYLLKDMKLGGIVGCSGANCLRLNLTNAKYNQTPVFLHHGSDDPVIPVSFAKI